MADDISLLIMLIIAVGFVAFLIALIIKYFHRRNASKHKAQPGENLPYTSMKKPVTEEIAQHMSHSAIIQQWRLQDAEKRSMLEKQIQGTSACKHHRKGKYREDGSSKERTAVVALSKTPDLINLHGLLAHTNEFTVFNKIQNELEYYHNKRPTHNMYRYLTRKFELSRKDDVAAMSLIKGNRVAWYMTGDTLQALTQCKQLQRDLHTYQLTNPAITSAHLYWLMHFYYTVKGKAGKARSALQAAVSCIQDQAPSTWTAHVCELQGYMYDRLALVRPTHRSKYQDLALRCFTNAREHGLCRPCQGEDDYVYMPLLYILEVVLIKLDLPTIHTIANFGESDIVYQRLSECMVSQWHVTEAQDLLKAVTTQVTELTTGWISVIAEKMLICDIILNIRLTQLAIADREYHSALNCVTAGLHLFDQWGGSAFIYPKALPHLARDIEKTLDNLYDPLILTFPPDPLPDPLSDSVSSVPSDVPPSGLQRLTEESRRAEKQAQRDKQQFSYSSGDIYTNSEDDVPSDVN